MKRVQPTKKIERQGIALIAKVVADMGNLWNEPQNDFGTDGSIELVDPATDEATNRIVLVQSKATSVAFGDRPIGFTCQETFCGTGCTVTLPSSLSARIPAAMWPTGPELGRIGGDRGGPVLGGVADCGDDRGQHVGGGVEVIDDLPFEVFELLCECCAHAEHATADRLLRLIERPRTEGSCGRCRVSWRVSSGGLSTLSGRCRLRRRGAVGFGGRGERP